MGSIVLGLVGLAALCELSIYVADVAGDFLRFANCLKKRLLE